MQPLNDEKREPKKAPEPPKEEPKPRRFRIVKLEERIAPQATASPPCTRIISRCA
jgi:hypothetical protein